MGVNYYLIFLSLTNFLLKNNSLHLKNNNSLQVYTPNNKINVVLALYNPAGIYFIKKPGC